MPYRAPSQLLVATLLALLWLPVGPALAAAQEQAIAVVMVMMEVMMEPLMMVVVNV